MLMLFSCYFTAAVFFFHVNRKNISKEEKQTAVSEVLSIIKGKESEVSATHRIRHIVF